MEIRLRGVLCVPHGSKKPHLDGNGQRAAGHLVDQLLQVIDLGTGAEIQPQGLQHLPEISQLLFARRRMDPGQGREALLLQVAGYRLVRRQHKLLDERMSRVSLLPVNALDLPVLPDPDLELGKVKKEGAAPCAGILETIAQECHAFEDGLVIGPVRGQIPGRNIAALKRVKNGEGLSIGKSPLAANHTAADLGLDEFSF